MGVGLSDLIVISRLGKSGHLKKGGAIMEIGAQQISDSALTYGDQIVESLQRAFDIPGPMRIALPKPGAAETGGRSVKALAQTAPMVEPMWTALGFRYAAIDIDGSPGSIPLDLNFDSVAPADKGRFDLVTNFGTTEHLINQLNAMKVIHDLTAPGGVMFHHLPGYGYVDHGLINYNPKFFLYLARSNRYEILHFDFQVTEASYDFPSHLLKAISPYNTEFEARARAYKVNDGGVQAVLRKTSDAAFLPPLDVPHPETLAGEPWMARYARPKR